MELITSELLSHPVIDDIMGSIESTDVQIGRETSKKLKNMMSLLSNSIEHRVFCSGKVSGRDVRAIGISNAYEDRFTLFTREQASMDVSMRTYERTNLQYLSIRGSPTKIDTGQNLIPRVSKETRDLRRKLGGVRLEEALIVRMYLMLSEVCEVLTGYSLFTNEEVNTITNGGISLKNLTYATFIRFGKNREERDRNFNLLACMMKAEVQFNGGSKQVSAFLKRGSEVKVWGDSSEFSRVTGLLIDIKEEKKSVAKVMAYLKDKVVEEKRDGSEKRNAEMMEKSEGMTEDLTTHVRFDCTFSADLLKTLVKWTTGDKIEGTGIPLREALNLFASKEQSNQMTRDVLTMAGLPRLIGASSMKSVVRSLRKDEASRALETWMKEEDLWDTNGRLKLSGKQRILEQLDKKVMDNTELRFAPLRKQVWDSFGIDLEIPPQVYSVLDRLRWMKSCMSLDEVGAVDLMMDHKRMKAYSAEEIKRVNAIQRRVLTRVTMSMDQLQKTVLGRLPATRPRSNDLKRIPGYLSDLKAV